MFLIGQTLNSSDPHVRTAMGSGDLDWLRAMAQRQVDAGMATIDVNAGALGDGEGEVLRWLLPWLENSMGRGLCIDSADATLLLELGTSCRHAPILNSFSLEDEWEDALIELLEGGASLIVQMRRAHWLPSNCEERLQFAEECVERIERVGLPASRFYLDPVLLPWGEDLQAGRGLLDFLERFDALPTLVGLSNVSFGHPNRRPIHARWFAELSARGLSAAIVDPFDPAWQAVDG